MKEYAIQTPRCPVQEILVDETARREPQALRCFENFHDEWKK